MLDNRYWRPSGETITIETTAITSPATVQTKIDSRVVHFTNMGGYVILSDDGATLYYKKVSNSYNGTTGYTEEELPAKLKGEKQFFELYLSHGVSSSYGTVENNSYFYAYLPEATVEQTNAYYSAPDVELLARSGKAHAVIEKTLNIVACNFFEEDLATVKVDAKIPTLPQLSR